MPVPSRRRRRPSYAPPVVRRSVTVLVVTLRSLEPLQSGRSRGRAAADGARPQRGRPDHRAPRRPLPRGLGSQLLGVFGLSASHEDDALRALNAAVQLREGVTTLLHGEPGHARPADRARRGRDRRRGHRRGDVAVREPARRRGRRWPAPRATARSCSARRPAGSRRTRSASSPSDPDTWLLSAIIPNAPAVRRRHSMPMVGRDDGARDRAGRVRARDDDAQRAAADGRRRGGAGQVAARAGVPAPRRQARDDARRAVRRARRRQLAVAAARRDRRPRGRRVARRHPAPAG